MSSISKYFKKLRRSAKKDTDSWAFFPRKDWSVVVAVGLVLATAVTAWHIYLYMTFVDGDGLFERRVTLSEKTEVIDVRELEEVIEQFEARRTRANQVLSN